MERQHEASLAGKVAIVTGSSRGLGQRGALALARRGARLVVTARTVDASGTELPGTIGQTVKEIESVGGAAVAVAADLSDERDLERIVAAATDRFGGVDILVNNAAVTVGYNWSTPLLDMPRADWLHHFAVNLHAPFTLAQLTVPSMEARGGGRFSNVVAPQLVAKNVFIMSVMPGWVATESAEANHELGDRQDAAMISMDVPARVLAYFAACENPIEYTGRVFFAERDLAALGLATED